VRLAETIAEQIEDARQDWGSDSPRSTWGKFDALFKANWRFGLDRESAPMWREWVEKQEWRKLERTIETLAERDSKNPPGLQQFKRAYGALLGTSDIASTPSGGCGSCDGGYRYVLMCQSPVDGWHPTNRNGFRVWVYRRDRASFQPPVRTYIDPVPCRCNGGPAWVLEYSLDNPTEWVYLLAKKGGMNDY
jgi:hypothetical protein